MSPVLTAELRDPQGVVRGTAPVTYAPEPEPPVGLAPGAWGIVGHEIQLGPFAEGQTRWKIAARNLGHAGGGQYHLTLPADVFEHTFNGPPPLITSRDFQVNMGRVGLGPDEWGDPPDWRNISALTGPTPPPDPDPDPAPPPSSGTVLFERNGPFRVMYRAGSNGGGGNVLGGVLGFPSFAETNHCAFEYLFTPDENFRHSVGGMKLPGIADSDAPTGGASNPYGWSYRLQLERTSSMPENEAFYVLYPYCVSPPSNTGGYGTRITGGGTRVYCRSGQQQRIRMEFLRGTPGQANGAAALTVNGVLAASHSGINWANPRTLPGGAVDLSPARKVQGESFFGGINVCPQDQWATFSGFRVIDLS